MGIEEADRTTAGEGVSAAGVGTTDAGAAGMGTAGTGAAGAGAAGTGAAGMGKTALQSKYTEGTATCPSCGATFDVVMWDRLEAACNPERAAQLATGSLLVARCPSCGAFVPLDYPLFYVDRERKVAAYYPAGRGGLDAVRSAFVAANIRFADVDLGSLRRQEFEMRVAPHRHQLVEKVAAWRAGLDDRSLEVLKAQLLAELKGRYPERSLADIQFTGMDAAGEKLVFDLFARADGSVGEDEAGEVVPAGSGISIPRGFYRAVAASADLHVEMDRNSHEPVIDAAWARKVLDAVAAAGR